jgi:tetratricopeptide (TPR) repeat protein
MRIAVKDRYLKTKQLQKQAHIDLAKYFQKQPVDARRAEEEPWQWKEAEEWESLRRFLLNREVFELCLYSFGKEFVLMYWLCLPNNNAENIANEYQKRWNIWGKKLTVVEKINLGYLCGVFLQYAGCIKGFVERIIEKSYLLARNNPNLNSIDLASIVDLYSYMKINGGNYLKGRELLIAEKERIISHSEGHPDLIRCLNLLGNVSQDLGEYQTAKVTYKEAFRISVENYGDNSPAAAQQIINLATLEVQCGNYSKAITYFNDALNINRRVFGSAYPHNISIYSSISIAYADLGDLKEAELQIRKSLNMSYQLLGEKHPQSLRAMSILGTILVDQNKFHEAESLALKALHLLEEIYPENHPYIALQKNNIGMVYDNLGKYALSISYYRQALDIYLVLGSERPNFGMCLSNLANALRLSGEYCESEVMCRRAIKILSKSLGPENIFSALALNNLAYILFSREFKDSEIEEIKNLMIESLDMFINILGPVHPKVGIVFNNLIRFYEKLKERELYVEARNFLTGCIEYSDKAFGNNSSQKSRLEVIKQNSF